MRPFFNLGFRTWVVGFGLYVDYYPHNQIEFDLELGPFYLRFGFYRWIR